ncbi:MAG TPA: hypothetical protein VMB03_20605 [Bryobacteraceae bacterium]|nr:hypothetical protein [Bryobacteraceae bacterium]
MADFRRWLTVLAVLAVVAFAANAQIGGGGSSGGALTCNATAGGTPELRPEGYTELAGDIVITCTGGTLYTPGTPIPTTNIVVYMTPSVPITSRFLGTSGASEALLLIDEPGSGLGGPAATGYGPTAPQVVCPYTGTGGCAAYAATDSTGTLVAAAQAGCISKTNSCTTAANVYQGKIGDYGPQSVTFYGVPVLPPATSGVERIFRVTNIRVPVASGQISQYLSAFISTNPNQVLPISSSAITIGVPGPAMVASVGKVQSFEQCVNETLAQTATLTFTEGFATSFKTRVVPLTNTQYAAEATNNGAPPNNQNIPGGLYGGFALNSESGLIQPNLTGTINGVVYTAGLADYGTRLKAVFTNIPSGLTLYVSNTSINTATPSPIGGTSTTAFAVLVATNSGEATPDSSSTAGFSPVGTSGTTALSASSGGSATAVWEVTNSNPAAIDVLQFGVYVSYTATSATSSAPYGLPITTLGNGPYGNPNNVALSFAPEPGGGTFSTANYTQGQVPTPRFSILHPEYNGGFVNIGLCETTLLYPYVTNYQMIYDTGIAVANTSMDPWNTKNQSGSCTLYGYGTTTTTSGSTAGLTKVQGCDVIANPLPGTNCFPVVPSGQVGTVLASSVFPGFQGYVIAICNFQYAHGYAAVTDLGIRNLWSSYLALELQGTGAGNGTPGISPRSGAQSIESLVH